MTNDDFIVMLTQKYYSSLFQYVSRVFHDRSMALDIVQETFLLVSEKADELQLHENIHDWLYNTARYKMLQYLPESSYYDALDTTNNTAYDVRDYSNKYMLSLEQKYPSIASQLSPEDLQLVIKRYEHGYEISELAEEYHTTETSIKMRLRQITDELRKVYSL